MLTILAAGIGLACLPTILWGLLIIALFLFILWLIISKLVPADFQATAKWVIVVVILIILLIFLIQTYQSGIGWLC